MARFPVPLDTLIEFVLAIHPDGDPLTHLGDSVRVSARMEEQADSLIGHFVDQARRSGASWSRIGERMGVTKQAVQQRFVARADAPGAGSAERMTSRMTTRTRDALARARRLAAIAPTDSSEPLPVEPRHIVAGLLAEDEGLAARAVRALGIEPAVVLAALGVAMEVVDAEGVPSGAAARVAFDQPSKELIARSLDIALHYGHNYIGTEHLILAAAEAGPTVAPLARAGVLLDGVEAELEKLFHQISG